MPPPAPKAKPLETYDISRERGFLSRFNAAEVTLNGDLGIAANIALRLPQILPSGEIRKFLTTNLPDTEHTEQLEICNNSEARTAMVHYAFMIQAYVWGEAEAPTSLPSCLARPGVTIANKIGQQPLLSYANYVLDNWSLIDPSKPLGLDNIYMRQHFLAGQDEAWFVLIHVAIEAQAGEVLARMYPIIDAAAQENISKARDLLEEMAGYWERINTIFDRMPEQCDPYIYFTRVRPYIHDWKDNPALPDGLVYEGVEQYATKPRAFRGQTGSQSSIVPTMDALLGIGHAADPLRAYLDQLHEYRPPNHRRFIDDIRKHSTLRKFVETADNKPLAAAYNANIQAVSDFRTRHLEYAASYINKQGKHAAGNDTNIGTGGTPFMKYLKKHRDETQVNLIQV